MPGRHKVSYDVFAGIDTDRSLELTEFAKSVIGISDWTDVIPGFDEDQLAERSVPSKVGTRLAARPVHEHPLATFEEDNDGWRASDNAVAVERVAGGYAGKGALRVRFDSAALLPPWSRNTKAWKGADVVLPEPVDARAYRHLNLAIRVPQPGAGDFQPTNVFYAKVQAYARDGHVAYGTARLDPQRGWNQLSLDLSGWSQRSELARIKVWVRGTTNDDWQGSFDLDQVSLSRHVAPASGLRNIDVSASLSDRRGIGSILSVTVTNNDATPLSEVLQLKPCDGVAVEPATLDVRGISTGETRTYEVKVTAFDPADADHPAICAHYQAGKLRLVFPLPPPTPTTVYDFENGLAGWSAGANVTSVTTVDSFANGPRTPHGGGWALEATATDVAASDAKTVSVEPDSPLDLSGASSHRRVGGRLRRCPRRHRLRGDADRRKRRPAADQHTPQLPARPVERRPARHRGVAVP